jgi:hypothetical protein
MAAFVPAIHDFSTEDVDARRKAGHDDELLNAKSLF